MKAKIIICFLTLIGIVACDSALPTPDMPDTQDKTETSPSYEADEDDAINSAALFFEGMKGKSRAELSKEVAKVSRINAKTSRSDEGSCGFYLINFDDGGFALTSADQRDSAKVYMASTNLNISEEFIQNDDFMNYMFSLIENYQDSVVEAYVPDNHISRSNDPVDHGGSLVTTRTENYKIGPLLTTAWSQGSPFNSVIYSSNPEDNDVMGCVPVAVGQIMAFHERPNKLHGTTLNWNTIKSVTMSTPRTSSDAIHTSLMIKYVGEDLGINYSEHDRGVYSSKVYNVLKSYGYTLDQMANFNYSSVLISIRNNRPVYMSGYDSKAYAGHAWVVDGAYSYTLETKAYDENGNYIPNDYVFDYNSIYTYTYIHVNPGWGESSLYERLLTLYNDPLIDGATPTTYLMSDIFAMDQWNFNSQLYTYTNIR